MTYNYILAIDPSGNFHEGKGTTGWCLYNSVKKCVVIAGVIEACNYVSMEAYWDAHIQILERNLNLYQKRLVIVIEDYVLYENRAASQINSKMETSKLIGLMQYWCYKQRVTYRMQLASEVKKRWTNDILVHKGILIAQTRGYSLLTSSINLSEHSLDAIRHAIHFAVFKNKPRTKAMA